MFDGLFIIRQIWRSLYRVGQVVVDLGLVDFDWDVPSSCPPPQPILPNFQVPKQNGTGNGVPKINVNPTQVHDHLPHPVHRVSTDFHG